MKRSRPQPSAAWLYCPYCRNPFKQGRSYSGHVRVCPAMRLTIKHPPAAAVVAPSQESQRAFEPDVFDKESSFLPPSAVDDQSEALFEHHDNDSLSHSSGDEQSFPFQFRQDHESDASSISEERSMDLIPPQVNLDEANNNIINPFDSLQANPTVLDNGSQSHILIPPITCYTLDDIAHLNLMNLCKELRAPLYAFDSILDWAQNAKASGYRFPTDAPSRKTFLDGLYKRFNMTNIKPKETIVALFPNKSAKVVTFSFIDMVQSLLDDSSLTIPSNLIDPSAISDDDISDIHTGSWFKAASVLLCINDSNVLCPIILFIDKTQVDTFGKWTLEPVLFTLGIFNQATRNLPQAWRPLGLVTNTIRMSSATHARMGKLVSTNHSCLS